MKKTPPAEVPAPTDAELIAIALKIDIGSLRHAFVDGTEGGHDYWEETDHEARCRSEGALRKLHAEIEAKAS